MPKNEDGEFELILGNRQLLSVFFIVIVLFAVFFVMGYILGRPVPPAPEGVTARKAEKPLVVESPAARTESEPPSRPRERAQAPSPTTPQALPEKAKPEVPTKVERAPKPRSEPVRKAEKSAPPTPAPASNEPAPGTYLQLAATAEHEANLEADVLRKKGFKALVAEVPDKPGVFRVLVGPLSDGNVNKTKADLQAGGFPGDKAIKRTY